MNLAIPELYVVTPATAQDCPGNRNRLFACCMAQLAKRVDATRPSAPRNPINCHRNPV
jgi:hypothetical protein